MCAGISALVRERSGRGPSRSAVLSQSSLEPPVSTHVFVFEPEARPGKADEPLGAALQEAIDHAESARAQAAREARRTGRDDAG